MRSAKPVFIFTSIIITWILCFPGALPGSPVPDIGESSPEVCPSRVLYLYNKDWKGGRNFVGDGYESREAAEHYVYMRTDTQTGEKPYMLGLSCRKGLGSYLNHSHLQEDSSDNTCGVVHRKQGSDGAVSACGMKDSRLVEVVLPGSGGPWHKETLRLDIGPEPGTGQERILLVESGESLYPEQVQVQHEGQWHIRANGRFFAQGGFTAVARCLDSKGSVHEWEAKYHDIRDAAFSRTGPDGSRNDQRYLDCVERPVKKFLEDPANARPDGTLLKDHILYIVVGFGLPRTVAAPYGIASGINENLRDHGPLIDLGQRLQTMYIDLQEFHRNQVVPHRFTSGTGKEDAAFTSYYFRTPLARGLWGREVNPFVHPELYERDSDKTEATPLRFTSQERKKRPQRHLFSATRIDAASPQEAMELVDRSVYASSYAGPAMGVLEGIELQQDPQRTDQLKKSSLSSKFWDLGYRRLYQRERGRARLELFRLAPETGFFNTGEVFLPGGMATRVISSSGLNRKSSWIHDFLRQGVTVTAGAARVGGGAPHIHSHSFWDEEVLYTFLLRGWPVGEILLMNQIHLNWITSYVGDPLLSLPSEPQKPSPMPSLNWDDDVQIRYIRDREKGHRYLITADLQTSPQKPRLAQMRLAMAHSDEQNRRYYVFERFSSRPYVSVPAREVQDSGKWILELIDPFGNTARLEGRIQ